MVTAWVLGSVSTLISVLAMVFVIAFRSNRIVMVGQPFFLFLICFGALLISISLYFDAGCIEEIPGITWAVLDRLCILQLWSLYLGILVVLMALICKLWRAEKACQFRKNQRILVQHVIRPFAAIVLLEMSLLVVSTTVCPPYWQEILMDPNGDHSALALVNKETISTITGVDGTEASLDDLMPKCFYSPLPVMTALKAISHIFIVVSQVIVVWMGYQTRNLSDDLVDTDQVFFMMVFQLALYVPFLLLEYGVIPSGRAYHYCSLIFPFCFSMLAIGFLIAPKVYCVFYQKRHGQYPERRFSRFSSTSRMSVVGSGRVHVSGVGPSLKATAAAATAAAAASGSGRRSGAKVMNEKKRHIDFSHAESTTRRESVSASGSGKEGEDIYDGVVAVPGGEGNP